MLNNIFTEFKNAWDRRKQGNGRAAVRMHEEAEDFRLEQQVEPGFEWLLLYLY
jgi:hypothetical protein